MLLLGAAFPALVWAARRLEAGGAAGGVILTGALLLRLCLLPLPLSLSDDAVRYLWDGRVAAAGQNPYLLAPESERLAPLREPAGGLPPHADVPTVYPPLAIAAFSIAARLPAPVAAWKTLAAAADLLGCLFLIRLARRLGLPAARAAWYAWNPLVVLEGAGMGHVDVLAVAAALGAVLLLVGRPAAAAGLERPRVLGAAAWAAAGVLAKLGPLAVLPFWARRSGRPALFLAAALGLTGLALLPVAAAAGGLPPGFAAYGLHWEFNGPLYEPLWRLLDAAGAAPALARGLDLLEHRTREFERWDWLYPWLYPQLLAKLALAAGALGVVLFSLRGAGRDDGATAAGTGHVDWITAAGTGRVDWITAAGTGRLFSGLLLCSATVYPWYLLWILPWAALARHPAWLALSGLLPLAYLTQAGAALWPWLYLAIWGPFFVLLAVAGIQGWRGWRLP